MKRFLAAITVALLSPGAILAQQPGFDVADIRTHPRGSNTNIYTPGCQGEPQNPSPGIVLPGIVRCHGMSMEAFSRTIREMAGDYLTSPVFNATGLQGDWDFDLRWINRGRLALAASEAISIFDAVD